MDTATIHPADSALYLAYHSYGPRLEIFRDEAALIAMVKARLASPCSARGSENAANLAHTPGTLEWASAALAHEHPQMRIGTVTDLIAQTNAVLKNGRETVRLTPDVSMFPSEVSWTLEKADLDIVSCWDVQTEVYQLAAILDSTTYRRPCVIDGMHFPGRDHFCELAATLDGHPLVSEWVGETADKGEWERVIESDQQRLDAIATCEDGWEVYA